MSEQKRKMPKGGRKGGKTFPRVNLRQAVEYAKKLVSKTHAGAQPKEIVYPGVFGTSGGDVRASALRQFGLLKGRPTAFEATDLAKTLVAAPEDEQKPLLAQSCLRPALFKKVFDTFQSDEKPRAKIRQQVLNFKVHPESADECVDLLIDSFVFAGLASAFDDTVAFVAAPTLQTPTVAPDEHIEKEKAKPQAAPPESDANAMEAKNNRDMPARRTRADTPPRRGTTQVNITIDPSMDPEKLERLLKVLREYGQI
jgi:hypothetical protein